MIYLCMHAQLTLHERDLIAVCQTIYPQNTRLQTNHGMCLGTKDCHLDHDLEVGYTKPLCTLSLVEIYFATYPAYADDNYVPLPEKPR